MCLSHPEMWPNRIQIAGRSPLARAHILQRQAIENKLPICQFRPLTTSSQQDQNNFTLLVKNLEQKKYVSCIQYMVHDIYINVTKRLLLSSST